MQRRRVRLAGAPLRRRRRRSGRFAPSRAAAAAPKSDAVRRLTAAGRGAGSCARHGGLFAPVPRRAQAALLPTRRSAPWARSTWGKTRGCQLAAAAASPALAERRARRERRRRGACRFEACAAGSARAPGRKGLGRRAPAAERAEKGAPVARAQPRAAEARAGGRQTTRELLEPHWKSGAHLLHGGSSGPPPAVPERRATGRERGGGLRPRGARGRHCLADAPGGRACCALR